MEITNKIEHRNSYE